MEQRQSTMEGVVKTVYSEQFAVNCLLLTAYLSPGNLQEKDKK